jgi:lipoyl synthase
MEKESPRYVRISLAAAMVLGFKNGFFYRNARSPCINLLLTYENGCIGNCAYCGLSMKRPGTYEEKSFIRVPWDSYQLDDIINRIVQNSDAVERICISMITNKRAIGDTIEIIQRIKKACELPIAILASPTILTKHDYLRFKEAGADRIGIAVDAATPSLFEKFRGNGVKGPHSWEKYWLALSEAVMVFGRGNVGVHLIVGLGEREEEIVTTIQQAHDGGVETHLFSFFPEPDSLLAKNGQPLIGQYRRIQLARYLINENLATVDMFTFDASGKITNFGFSTEQLMEIVDLGKPFMTSGCPSKNGEVACNRPYSDSLPGPEIRNYPFLPEQEDIQKIKIELQL